jgi:hypothetical protein
MPLLRDLVFRMPSLDESGNYLVALSVEVCSLVGL